MKKLFKKSLAVIMIVILTLTAAPLGGLVGLDLPGLFNLDASALDKVKILKLNGTEFDRIEILFERTDYVVFSGIRYEAVFADVDFYLGGEPCGWAELHAAEVTGCSEEPKGKVAIRSSVHVATDDFLMDYGVAGIGAAAFSNYDNLTSVIIPGETLYIENNAFADCDSLEYVHIPASVKEIGSNILLGTSAYICSPTEDCYAKTYADNNGIEFRICNGHNTDNPTDNPDNPTDTPNEPTTKPNQPENPVDKTNTVKGRNFKNNIDAFLKAYNSSTYNPELANILAAFSAAAYNKQELLDAYKSFGFENAKVYDYDGEFNPYSCGYALAFKKSEYSDETICLVTVKGTNNISDWAGNIELETDYYGHHIGFAFPAYKIFNTINTELTANNITGNVKYVFTGHSRGAAVANLASVTMMKTGGVDSANVYSYNFATPNVAYKENFAEYDNIYNICNSADLVPYIPAYPIAPPQNPGGLISIDKDEGGNTWGKYGKEYYFTEKKLPSVSLPGAGVGGVVYDVSYVILNHSMENTYLKEMDTQVPLSEFNDTNPGYSGPGVASLIFCPVDVLITDKNGNKLVSVINGEIKYYSDCFGNIIVMTYEDHKFIYTQEGFDINISLIGTDKGEMTYCVEKINIGTREVFDGKTFKNVKLEKGKQMYSPLSYNKTSDVELFVVKEENGKKVITHTIDANGRETESYHRNIKEINIVKPSTETVNYGDTLILHADLGESVLVEGYKLEWLVEGDGVTITPSKNGLTCNVTSVKTGTVTVTARIVDKDGNIVLDANGKEFSASQTLTSKAGLWQKIVSFFKNLFRTGRTIEQRIKSDR